MADPSPAPPRPADHPENLSWEPPRPNYPPDSPARSNEESKQAFNEQAARAAFGDAFIDALQKKHERRAFRGDWWMLAMLCRCEEAARIEDPKGELTQRLAWWNSFCDRWWEEGVRLRLDGADLSKLRLQRAKLRGAHLEAADLAGAHLDHADLSHSYLRDAILHCTSLRNSKVCHAFAENATLWDANLASADLSEARMGGTSLVAASLEHVTLWRADLRGAKLARSDVSAAKIGGANLIAVRGLFGANRAIARSQPIEEHESQNAIYRWEWRGGGGHPNWAQRFARAILKDHIGWDLLRLIGTLRLFGVSYFTVAAITIYILFARRYNALAAHVRETGQATLEEAVESVPFWATAMLRLPDLPTPGHLGRQLVATMALAIAATIYVFACPSEVKEATEVRWTRAMGQPLWEYRSANWCRPIWRYICFVFFAVGGLYSVVYLGSRALDAAKYLLGGG